MTRKIWTDEEVEVLRRDYPDSSTKALAERLAATVRAVYAKASAIGIKKSAEYLAGPDGCRFQSGNNVSTATRFKPGHRPHNAGKKGFQAGGNSVNTQFKKGQLNGRAAQLVVPIGTERITREGYLERKVNNDMPFQQRWRPVHNLLWEEHNGPIPQGHVVVFRNGNKRDIRIDNLALISRAELMRNNSICNYPTELRSVIRLAGKLRRAIYEKQD